MHRQILPAKQLWHVNIDETSTKLDKDVRHGHVTQATQKLAEGNTLRRRIPRAHTRTAHSLVAVICDDVEIQQSLLMFILVNKKGFTEADYRSLLDSLPAKVMLWGCKSSWMDITSASQVVRDIQSHSRGTRTRIW